jgi:hypothetical protein
MDLPSFVEFAKLVVVHRLGNGVEFEFNKADWRLNQNRNHLLEEVGIKFFPRFFPMGHLSFAQQTPTYLPSPLSWTALDTAVPLAFTVLIR